MTAEEGMTDNDCGGCKGLGAHSPRCHTQPGYHWRRLRDQAGSLGDQIGSNAPALANAAYALAAQLHVLERIEIDAGGEQ